MILQVDFGGSVQLRYSLISADLSQASVVMVAELGRPWFWRVASHQMGTSVHVISLHVARSLSANGPHSHSFSGHFIMLPKEIKRPNQSQGLRKQTSPLTERRHRGTWTEWRAKNQKHFAIKPAQIASSFSKITPLLSTEIDFELKF